MKSFVRMFMQDGGWHRWIDVPLPEGATFGQFMAQARFEGHVMSEIVYIPLDQIKIAMLVKLQQAEAQVDFTKAHLQ